MSDMDSRGRKLQIAGLWLIAMGSALAVAGVNAKSSWGHIVHVGVKYGEPSANVLPVAVDGMMLAGTALCAYDRLRGYRSRGWALACLWVGSLLTLGFNAVSALERGWFAVAIACVYAVTFIMTIEAIFRGARKAALKITQAQPAPAPMPAVTPETPAPPSVVAVDTPEAAMPAGASSAPVQPSNAALAAVDVGPADAVGSLARPRQRRKADGTPGAIKAPGRTPELITSE